MNEEYNQNLLCIAIKLANSIIRLERENVDLTVGDIKSVRELKNLLGYKVPVSIEEGLGMMILNVGYNPNREESDKPRSKRDKER
jgi:hypothetical protein